MRYNYVVTNIKQDVSEVCSANAHLWAAEVLRRRFEEILEFREAALEAEGTDGVHKMRVAIRRLRSALRDFSSLLKKHSLKKSNRDLKRLADALGAVRDQDVAIAALEKLFEKAGHENFKKTIEERIGKHRLKRISAHFALTGKLDPSEIEALHKRFLAALDENSPNNGKDSDLTVGEAAHVVISNIVQEFCDLSDHLYDPYNRENLHELRISSKRLRYAIELFTVCYGEQIAPFAESIAELQTFLGELHDCDLWIEKLSRRLSKRQDKKNRADLWILSRFVKKRAKNYRAALRLWSRWQKNDFIKKLQAVLELDSNVEKQTTL